MEDAYRLAKAVCMAGMNPKGMDTPEKCMIAIMRGMEVGLTPFQALDKIAVVNGRPVIWGDGALALVRGSGLCEYVKEAVDGKGDERGASCETKRKGEREPIRRTFNVADARKAGLWGKAGPWQQFPDRMLQMRARAFCLRDGFADVLGGLYLKEEMDSADAPRASMPTPPAPPSVPQASIAAPDRDAATEPSQGQEQAIDFGVFRSELQSAATLDEANVVFDRWITPREKHMSADEIDEANAILREACGRFWTEDGE
jgi:hypothetical protein